MNEKTNRFRRQPKAEEGSAKKRNSFFKKLYDECDDIHFEFSYDAQDEAQNDLEHRYKIIVVTILPILLSRVRAIFFTLAFLVGLLLLRFFQ